jgi:hypothetical protein
VVPTSTDLHELADALDARAAVAASIDVHATATAAARGADLARELAAIVTTTTDRDASRPAVGADA